MRGDRFVLTPLLAIVVLGASGGGAAGAQTPSTAITGTLDKPGYAVIALDAAGSAATASAPGGPFTLVPSRPTVTLHLRAPDGTYAGPVVPRLTADPVAGARRALGRARIAATTARRALVRATRAYKRARRAGHPAAARARMIKARRRSASAARLLAAARRALAGARKDATARASQAPLGIRAGAPLGAIAIDTAGGYAVAKIATAAAWKRWVDTGVAGQSLAGVPIGAGTFGRVASSRHDGAAIGDLDLDGIPGPLDIDDDGDLVLDEVDSATAARGARLRGTFPDGSHLHVNTLLQTHEEGATSANGGASDAQIAEAQAGFGQLNILWTGVDAGTGELDCGQLAYCRADGTGRLYTDPVNPYRDHGTPYPACCDTDGDGLGSLTSSPSIPAQDPSSGGMSLFHGATLDQIGTGDILLARGLAGGVPFESATTVGFAFSTASVPASIADGQGDPISFTYPRGPLPPPATPVRAAADGTLGLTLTFWRPQRERIAAEPGTGRWIDMGGLVYQASLFVPSAGPSNQTTVFCPASSLSEDDPNLSIAAGPSGVGTVEDAALDAAADPAATFTYRLDVTSCLASKGLSLATGQDAYLNFTANAPAEQGRSGGAVSALHIKRVS